MTESLLQSRAYAPGVIAVREHPEVARLQEMLEELAAMTGPPEVGGEAAADAHRIDQLRMLEQIKAAAAADAHRIDQLRMLEQIKAAAAAAQARVTVAFEASQLAEQEAAGVRRSERAAG